MIKWEYSPRGPNTIIKYPRVSAKYSWKVWPLWRTCYLSRNSQSETKKMSQEYIAMTNLVDNSWDCFLSTNKLIWLFNSHYQSSHSAMNTCSGNMQQALSTFASWRNRKKYGIMFRKPRNPDTYSPYRENYRWRSYWFRIHSQKEPKRWRRAKSNQQKMIKHTVWRQNRNNNKNQEWKKRTKNHSKVISNHKLRIINQKFNKRNKHRRENSKIISNLSNRNFLKIFQCQASRNRTK